MSSSSPIKLTDNQMSAVLAASYPLSPDRRSAFLADVARELASLPEVGDGIVHRVIMARQRVYFDPPIDKMGGHGVGKYA
jgi:hypothetical protein